MSDSNFTLESALAAFQLEKVESAGTFSEIDPMLQVPTSHRVGEKGAFGSCHWD